MVETLRCQCMGRGFDPWSGAGVARAAQTKKEKENLNDRKTYTVKNDFLTSIFLLVFGL